MVIFVVIAGIMSIFDGTENELVAHGIQHILIMIIFRYFHILH